MRTKHTLLIVEIILLLFYSTIIAQIGRRFPSEKKVITDPVTGSKLIFLTSTQAGDSKIYPTHTQWTSDGNWIVFRSNRVRHELMAVNENSGEIVQVTEGGYTGTPLVSRKSMKLYYMRDSKENPGSREIVETNLEKLFNDIKTNNLKGASEYQHVCGVIPSEFEAYGDLALDANEEWIWFRVGRNYAMKYLPEGTKIEGNFGPRNMGAGPSGIAGFNVNTGEIKYVISVPFQIGHIQSNPWVAGQIIFCWETGGKSPQRTWIVNSDGTGLRPLYPEAPYEWVTHEVVITPDEVAFAIMGHRKIPGNYNDTTIINDVSNLGQEKEWGNTGTREKPTGLAVVNIKTKEMFIAGQITYGSGFWHVAGSSDGRFLAGDNFEREIYLIDRQTHEMILLSAGHKTTARDHPHPSFSPDGTKILIQSAMLSEDGRSMNLCIIPVPDECLKRNYKK
ncbi:TolB family protein [Rosettibacter firmus]|uniref:TolB family protein n=1 Tax=Rosettibacter firmus TaxID=3111522 RepID=UPI00336C1A58